MSANADARDAITESRQPHDGECCPCVERLRCQNKASSDEWTKRTAEQQSDLAGLRLLMRDAASLNRSPNDGPGRTVEFGLSLYGQAALATALMEADELRTEAAALRIAIGRERRSRIVAEDRARRAEEKARA